MKHWFFTIHRTPKRETVTEEFALEILKKHTAYFKELGHQGICLMAGPFADRNNDVGAGCFVFAAETEEAARKLEEADPLVLEGLYDYKIYEWIKVVPE